MAKPKTASSTAGDMSDYLAEELDKTAIEKTQLDALDFSLDDIGDLDRVQVDVDGYWNADKSPIYGTLLGVAKAIETPKGVTGIYAVQLLRDCAGRSGSQQESPECVMKTGQIVGVFHSFGLNPLKEMGGARVAIKRSKEKTLLNNGNEMWNYDIRADKVRNRVQIIDNRSPENSGAPF